MGYVKRAAALLGLAVLTVAGAPSLPVKAHVLESDNGVSAILHIKPFDRPVAGQTVPVNFLFTSDAGGFSLNDYDLQMKLLKGNTAVLKQTVEPAFFGAATRAETDVKLPAAGEYTIQAIGTPVKVSDKAFKLSFTVRIADNKSLATVKQGDGSMPLIFGGLSLITLGVVATKSIRSGGRYNSSNKMNKRTKNVAKK